MKSMDVKGVSVDLKPLSSSMELPLKKTVLENTAVFPGRENNNEIRNPWEVDVKSIVLGGG